jgi:nucleoside phosphorylase
MSNPHKTLIHTALIYEARPLIQTLKLRQNTLLPTIYENDMYILVVSGIGKNNTTESLETLFKKQAFKRAVNIGIAGCKEKEIPIGTLFCTNQQLKTVPNATISCVTEPLDAKSSLSSLLVDMESDAFLEVCTKYLPQNECFVFKVVSDYCNSDIPKKSFVIDLIQKQIKTIKEFL